MGVLSSIATAAAGFGKLASAIAEWWAESRAQKKADTAQHVADAVAADPAAEWVRQFGGHKADTAPAPNPAKPDADQ